MCLNMVQQTRRVVEDYILYRIRSEFSKDTFVPCYHHCINETETRNFISGLPPQQAPSRLNLAMRNLASQFERKYKETFPDMFDQIRSTNISSEDVDHLFSKMCKDLFPLKQTYASKAKTEHGNMVGATADNKYTTTQGVACADNHIKWGRVVALVGFAAILAVRAVECGSAETVDKIVIWVTNYLDKDLSHWMASQGGWEKFLEWSKGGDGGYDCSDIDNTNFDPNSFANGLGSVLKVGVLAACVGFGALMMVKK